MNCIFCNTNNNKIENTILYESKYFIVLPTIGSLVDGYILIVSKRHVNSMSELNFEERVEYENILNKYREVFKKTYNKYPIIFEHGSPIINDRMKANSVTHAHTHIVNHKFEDEKTMIEKMNFTEIQDLSYLTKEKNYIMYINGKNISYITNNFEPISQIMRKLIAKDLGFENKFDWKKEMFLENIKNTISKIKEENLSN